MIHHIALTVHDAEEVKLFYENILLCTVDHTFRLSSELSSLIFAVGGEPDVYLMRHQNIVIELFLSPEKEHKVYSHVCLAYWKSERIYEEAVRNGYKTFVKKRTGHDTYFVWDKAGNLFEIKEIEDDEPMAEK